MDPVTVIGFGVGVAAVIAVVALVVINPNPSPAQFNVFRTVIALGGAGFALSLTGFLTLQMEYSEKSYIRAGGTLAVFVLLYLFSPATSLGAKPKPDLSLPSRANDLKAGRRLVAEFLIELRNRFRLALARTKDRDRLEFPRAWSSNLLEGGGNRMSTENSHDLITRISALLSTQHLEAASRQLAEVSQIVSRCSALKDGLGDGPADEQTWEKVKEQLNQGYALVNSSLEHIGLGMDLAIMIASHDTHTNAQPHPAPPPILNQLDSAKQVIYDSTKDCYESDFRGLEGFFWKGIGDKAEKISGQGLGFLEVEGGVLNLHRTNKEGRFEIQLRRYSYNGQDEECIPKNVEISGKRKLRIACQAKVPEGEHSLHFVLKNEETQIWLAHQTKRITKSRWTDINLLFLVDPTLDCRLRIDDQDVSKAPSSIQIRNLLVVEEV